MLKETLSQFYALADEARQKVGDSAPRVTDEIIERAFPKTLSSSELEGCDKMLREGVVRAIKSYIRKPEKDTRQRTFADIAPDILPTALQLGSVAYYVPDLAGGEYVTVPDLCEDPVKLNLARAFMREKGAECLREADRLDELYELIVGA